MFGGLEGNTGSASTGYSRATEQAQEEAETKKSADDAVKAADELKVALKQQIDQGLVAVEQDEDKVIITVGAGGAFASGSADLTLKQLPLCNKSLV